MPEIIQKALATIEEADSAEKPNGGFTAVLSTPSQDRDGDQLARDEWQEPLPDRIPIDVDHEMSVRGTVGSGRPYFDEAGRMMLDVDFASTPQAQEVRTLVKEGHIGAVSVAFLTDKSKKDGVPRRELLNAGIVAIPSNRDAVILSAKEFASLSARKAADVDDSPEQLVAGLDATLDQACALIADVDSKSLPEPVAQALDLLKSAEAVVDKLMDSMGVYDPDDGDAKGVATQVITKASQAEASLIQGIHDAAAHLGAQCVGAAEPEPDPDDGSDDGANKSTKPNTVTITVKPELDLEAFKAQIDRLTKSSGAEPDATDDESAPADAASEAASEQEPAEEPADAAVDESDELAQKMLAELLISSIDLTELDS